MQQNTCLIQVIQDLLIVTYPLMSSVRQGPNRSFFLNSYT